ncbi:polyprenyl synthetase family protein [Vicingus serpentipes]|uniref:Polyprenyl synthetase family protein n=1 Tax=Vicingus serpentipes TaxID=1926625 RepID=A0A5C6RNX7_9FLAO|nr:polyprenyl synthetase family protein [Vicingus serpentipes]TXB63933.1 polyprenyl synthetase family protein [Vicingus serpentipes]
MEKINHYISIVNQAIDELSYNKEPKKLYEPIKYTLTLGGKRIRPALLLLANDLFGGKAVRAMNSALAIEVFHNFTLVHDDIMDDAPLRRGKTTVFKKWDTNTAILSGDVMFVNAIQLLAKDNNDKLADILAIFNKASVEVCEGQQYDMDFETLENVSIDDYLKMIELKTAVLLAASLKIGALIANAKQDDANHIYEFGRNLGIAFQLMDDILDLYGDPEKFGKQVGGDVIANKKTYLLLKAKELAKGETRKELEFCLTSTAIKPENKVERIKTIFNALGVKKAAIDEMNLFYNTAISHLDSIDAPEDKKKVFEDFAKQLMHREN